jgi:hypothetical protein
MIGYFEGGDRMHTYSKPLEIEMKGIDLMI